MREKPGTHPIVLPARVESMKSLAFLAVLLFPTLAFAQDGELTRSTGWHWTKITDSMAESIIADPERYGIVFAADGTLSVAADCNTASGTYHVTGPEIAITLGPVTLAECGPESDSAELLEALPYSATWSIDQRRTLTLEMLGDGGFLTFHPAE